MPFKPQNVVVKGLAYVAPEEGDHPMPPIYIPITPPPDSGLHPEHPIYFPVAPDDGPHPEHPIYLPGGGTDAHPEHPIYYPVVPTHPIVIPPECECDSSALRDFLTRNTR